METIKEYRHRGYSIWYNGSTYKVSIEDGMYTYSLLEYQTQTLKEAKAKIDQYNARINKNYQ